MNTKSYEIILASGSPRRRAFFEDMGIPFTRKVIPVEEVFPKSLSGKAIVEHLVKLKAAPFKSIIKEKQLGNLLVVVRLLWISSKDTHNQCRSLITREFIFAWSFALSHI